jgi:hypothetical protein
LSTKKKGKTKMIEKIEHKMTEVVEAVLAKPTSEFTKSDFDVLSAEYNRLKFKIDSENQNKRMAEMMASIWAK